MKQIGGAYYAPFTYVARDSNTTWVREAAVGFPKEDLGNFGAEDAKILCSNVFSLAWAHGSLNYIVMPQIVPSILSADFAHLADDIDRVSRAGVQMLHIDIMDGHFVPNLTMGPPIVSSIRKVTQLTLDLHLMIENPDTYIPLFVEAGADMLSVHHEVCRHLDRTLRLIRSEGARPGVVLNPATPVGMLEDVLDLVDHVLVMSVNPGFGGQKFIPHSLDKIRALAEIRRKHRLDFAIEIDGGVSSENVEVIVQAGCDWLVAGSAVFHSADPAATVKEMQHLASEATAIRV